MARVRPLRFHPGGFGIREIPHVLMHELPTDARIVEIRPVPSGTGEYEAIIYSSEFPDIPEPEPIVSTYMRVDKEPKEKGCQIRHTHELGFRVGEWADIVGFRVHPKTGYPCYMVQFKDGTVDYWVMGDPNEPYEFRAAHFIRA